MWRRMVETLGSSQSRAVLMRHNGPLTVGRDAGEAVKTAVPLEDVARTVHEPRSSIT